MKTFTLIKIARGEYQVIDENGVEQFTLPASKHNANLFIIEYKTDEKFLANKDMQKVAKRYINDRNMPVSSFGDLKQFMFNSIYKMGYRDIIRLMRSQYNYRNHLNELERKNYLANQKRLTDEV